MCFGDRSANPRFPIGTDDLDQSHTRTNDYLDQHLPNRTVRVNSEYETVNRVSSTEGDKKDLRTLLAEKKREAERQRVAKL